MLMDTLIACRSGFLPDHMLMDTLIACFSPVHCRRTIRAEWVGASGSDSEASWGIGDARAGTACLHAIRMASACHQNAISMPSACHQHVISMQACTLVLDLVLEINRDGTALHADCMLIT